MKTILSLLICLTLFPPVLGEEKSSKELLRDGLFEEEVNQDFSKAEAAYRSVTKRYDDERYFAGLAFFRLAEIARKSGNTEQAQSLYRRVALEFNDQKEIAKRAAEQLGEEAPNINRIASSNPLTLSPGNAESLELKRLQKMERDSPDLLNGVGEDGWHPLHKAAANGWTNAVDFLLERKVTVDPRASIKTEYRSEGYTPLHLAVIHGHLSVVDRLLATKADPSLSVYISPADLPLPVQSKSIQLDSPGDWSPLHLSILFQRREIMTRLLKANASLASGGPALSSYKTTTTRTGGHLRTTSWKFGGTPLMLAIWLNDRAALQTLLDHGADINQAASEEGETPLLAAIWKTPELVPTLLDQGAKVNDDYVFGRTNLHWAIAKCDPPVILRLIKEGADVNSRVKTSRDSYEGYPSPLEIAMRWDFNEEQREELCDALLKAGAKPSTRVLTSAASYGHLKTMRALIAAKVDPNGSNDRGFRPLHYVKNAQAAKILVEAGARLEVKNHDGITPFGSIVNLEDTPDSRALVDYLLEQGADTSMLSYFLFSKDENFGDNQLLPYVMSKTKLADVSDPNAVMLAFPRNWSVAVGEHRILPGTPAPSLKELISLNYAMLSDSRIIKATNSSNRTSSRTSRHSGPEVVTDLVIYRPNEQGDLVEVAQLANQGINDTPNPELQWGDIVVYRQGLKKSDTQQMPLIHYASGLKPRTITLKVGPWEHKVRIENTHQSYPGLDLQDHITAQTPAIDPSKIILRRTSGESKTINLSLPHGPRKVRLMDGDTIEYSLKPQSFHDELDPFSADAAIHLFFPDRPQMARSEGRGKRISLVDFFRDYSPLEGRDFTKAVIQRMGEEKLERIPLDLLTASQNLTGEESSIAKATELLKTTIYPGDILIFPPKENLSWSQRNSFSQPYADPTLSPLLKLVHPTPRPRTNYPIPKPTSKSSPTRVRRVPTPPSR